MTLTQLRYIIAIADTGSMNEAAKSLFISQPSLSLAVKELEKEKISVKSDVIKEEKVVLPSWVKDVEKIDPLSMSPLEAINFLYDLKKKMKER